MLSSILSLTAPGDTASLVFAAVFVIVWFGAALVTLNAQLLGGTISFFQSICILGYCVFPLTLSGNHFFLFKFLSFYSLFKILSSYLISAFTCLIIGLIFKQILLKLVIVGVGFVWSTRGKLIFILLFKFTRYFISYI